MGDKASESGRVFINYRRADTQEVALHLYRELGRCLEQAEVFFDQRELEAAAAFPDALRQEVSRATVVLVLIGPRWLTLQTPDGIRRLDDPDDWVRPVTRQRYGAPTVNAQLDHVEARVVV